MLKQILLLRFGSISKNKILIGKPNQENMMIFLFIHAFLLRFLELEETKIICDTLRKRLIIKFCSTPNDSLCDVVGRFFPTSACFIHSLFPLCYRKIDSIRVLFAGIVVLFIFQRKQIELNSKLNIEKDYGSLISCTFPSGPLLLATDTEKVWHNRSRRIFFLLLFSVQFSCFSSFSNSFSSFHFDSNARVAIQRRVYHYK